MFGNEEDFIAALGYDVAGTDSSFSALDPEVYATMLRAVIDDFPNVKLIATSLRTVHSATINDWGGICLAAARVVTKTMREGLEILDRIGGGDSFASGIIYGLLSGLPIERALDYGIAHGALAMTTPGDTSMATLADVEQLAAGRSARAAR
jgi:2-dehydro-3-deoxygluconokinase